MIRVCCQEPFQWLKKISDISAVRTASKAEIIDLEVEAKQPKHGIVLSIVASLRSALDGSSWCVVRVATVERPVARRVLRQ